MALESEKITAEETPMAVDASPAKASPAKPSPAKSPVKKTNDDAVVADTKENGKSDTNGHEAKKSENGDKNGENGHKEAGKEIEPSKPAAEATSPTKQVPEAVNKAMQHLASGKRNLLVSDIPAAVNEMEEACRLLGEHYGETAVECAEAYFHYGKALLEMARLESGVINNAGEDEEEEEQEEEDEEEKEEEKEEDKPEESKTETKDEEEKKPEESKEEKSDEKPSGSEPEKEKTDDKEENESIGSNEAGTSDIKDTNDKTEIDKEEDEDPSNFQLSWEMLELAKSLFKKNADSLPAEDKKRLHLESRLSETYQVLGELSIENENYPQAIEDLTCCLRRRQDLLPEDSRCIAETNYQLGVAYGFNLEFDQAVGSLNDAIDVLQKRIDNLKENKQSEDPSLKKDAFYTTKREIEEIEGLIPEIREKIADTNDMKQETFKKLGDRARMEESIAAQAKEENNGKVLSPIKEDKPISDISHMVKKRKKSDEPSEGVSDAKRPNLTEDKS